MSAKYDWDGLVEQVEKIQGDLPDIGFMIEFCKIWIPVKDMGDRMAEKLDRLEELNKKYRLTLQLHALSFLKEFEPLLEESLFRDKRDI